MNSVRDVKLEQLAIKQSRGMLASRFGGTRYQTRTKPRTVDILGANLAVERETSRAASCNADQKTEKSCCKMLQSSDLS
eukprot:scaffold323498_cov45-Prasinocladus_malaysianus.AAC.1